MRVSAALQILTTVMSGTANGGDSWSSSQHVQQVTDLAPRADLDLGACLDVETLEDLGQHLYSDPDTQPAAAAAVEEEEEDNNAWVENVIDMTSSGELTSSGDHAGVVPNMAGYSLSGGLPAADGFDFSFMDSFTGTDNATFMSLGDALTTSTATGGETNVADTSTSQAFAPFGSLSSAALTNTTTSTSATIDLTTLEQLMTTVDAVTDTTQGMETFGGVTAINSSSSSIPSLLWNLDLTLPGSEAEDTPLTGTASGSSGVKETLKNRLYSRGSVNSVSLDSDVNASSTRSLMSSPTSSLMQSFDDDDADDPVKMLEKREKNRVAAQKCRNKKREKTETLEKSVSRLEQRQERLKEEVQKLRDERETLEEIINVHGMFCPKIRKVSNS
ncbi:uncharacterized protein LOC143281606 [Babylonia areolata]|uniref:uncharacterized protein LOC143281606 n=1 Tax=Babylonia areolata TaxID=304850 RepID=UPI003FD3E620